MLYKIRVSMIVILIFMLFTFGVYGISTEKATIYKSNDIGISINREQLDVDKYLINGKLYAPVRELFEKFSDVSWNQVHKHVSIKTYKDFKECDYQKGEHFVYGLITKVDYKNNTINIEQHFDDNSREILSPLYLRDDVIIVLKRNDKCVNLDIADLKCGDLIGAVVDKDDSIRGLIITL
ncbi:hypothetical protein PV797_17155 [Clostridiaceae bacterium M8S5]|nr:hypothetical protein PV797_17155 [Clostridiaceae bacterium M8S5]